MLVKTKSVWKPDKDSEKKKVRRPKYFPFVPQEHEDGCKRLPLSCFNKCGKSDIPRQEVAVQFAMKSDV